MELKDTLQFRHFYPTYFVTENSYYLFDEDGEPKGDSLRYSKIILQALRIDFL